MGPAIACPRPRTRAGRSSDRVARHNVEEHVLSLRRRIVSATGWLLAAVWKVTGLLEDAQILGRAHAPNPPVGRVLTSGPGGDVAVDVEPVSQSSGIAAITTSAA